ncbi:hypothetical protein UlMin_033299 [Ulmus minor]
MACYSSLLFIFFFFINPCFSELCNPREKQALLQIKQHFRNPSILKSWKPSTDCCKSWEGVTCYTKTHRVKILTVNWGLSGQIPPQIRDLPYLQTLEFRKSSNLTGPIQPAIAELRMLMRLCLDLNSLTGSIPDFLTHLNRLTFLDLSYNSLTGSVPAGLGGLKYLTFLDLFTNKLTGTIPSSLSNLPNISQLRLDRNKLTGSIPDSFGSFVGNVPDLYLSNNKLSGKIPASLGKMNFGIVDFSVNKLEGDGSMLFGSNKTSLLVDLSRNLLAFDLSKVEFSQSLIGIALDHNMITGSLPVGLTALDSLLQFNVSYNRLCGKIPVGGKVQSFDDTSYFHNRCLCGVPLPSCKK